MLRKKHLYPISILIAILFAIFSCQKVEVVPETYLTSPQLVEPAGGVTSNPLTYAEIDAVERDTFIEYHSGSLYDIEAISNDTIYLDSVAYPEAPIGSYTFFYLDSIRAGVRYISYQYIVQDDTLNPKPVFASFRYIWQGDRQIITGQDLIPGVTVSPEFLLSDIQIKYEGKYWIDHPAAPSKEGFLFTLYALDDTLGVIDSRPLVRYPL